MLTPKQEYVTTLERELGRLGRRVMQLEAQENYLLARLKAGAERRQQKRGVTYSAAEIFFMRRRETSSEAAAR